VSQAILYQNFSKLVIIIVKVLCWCKTGRWDRPKLRERKLSEVLQEYFLL